MRLHLPSSLRKALLTCLAAFSPILTATVATGSLLVGGSAAVTFLLAGTPSAQAFTAPDVNFGDAENITGGSNKTVDGDVSLNITSTGNVMLSTDDEDDNNLKLNLLADGVTLVRGSGNLSLDNLWLTSDNDRRFVSASADVFADVSNLYIDGARLKITNSGDARNTNITLGGAGYDFESEKASYKYNSTLLLEMGSGAFSIKDLIVQGREDLEDPDNLEDPEKLFAQVGLSNTSALIVTGKLTGSGSLRIVTQNGGSRGNSYVFLQGGTENFTGNIVFGPNTNYLQLGTDISIGALETRGDQGGSHLGSAGHGIIYSDGDEVYTITLTAASGTYTFGYDWNDGDENNRDENGVYSGSSNSNSSIGEDDNRFSLVKNGRSTQVIKATYYGQNVTVNEGSLVFSKPVFNGTGNYTVDIAGTVNVVGGTLEFQGDASLATLRSSTGSGNLKISSGRTTVTSAVNYNSRITMAGGQLSLANTIDNLVLTGATLAIQVADYSGTDATAALFIDSSSVSGGTTILNSFLSTGIKIALIGSATGETRFKLFDVTNGSIEAGLKEDIIALITDKGGFHADAGIDFDITTGEIIITPGEGEHFTWSGGSGNWNRTGGGNFGESYVPSTDDYVIFSNDTDDSYVITGAPAGQGNGALIQAGTIEIAKGRFTFQMQAPIKAFREIIIGSEGRAVVTFTGARALSSDGALIINNESLVTIGTTAGPAFASVSLENNSTLVISNGNTMTNWNACPVTGSSGTLAFSNCGDILSANFNKFFASVSGAADEKHLLGSLRLKTGTNLFLNDNSSAQCRSIRDVYVESGASIGTNSPSMNDTLTAPENKTILHLSGTGINNSGALYLGLQSAQFRAVSWNIVVEEGGAMVMTCANKGYGIDLTGVFNGNGQVLTINGGGSPTSTNTAYNSSLRLSDNTSGQQYFCTAAGSTGTFYVATGGLDIGFSEKGADQLANYDVKLADGASLRAINNYTLHALYGAGSVKGCYYPPNSNNDAWLEGENAEHIRTLTIKNHKKTAAADETTFTFTGSTNAYAIIALDNSDLVLGTGANLAGDVQIGSGSSVEVKGNATVTNVSGDGTLKAVSGTLTANGSLGNVELAGGTLALASATQGSGVAEITQLHVTDSSSRLSVSLITLNDGVGLLHFNTDNLIIDDTLTIVIADLSEENISSYHGYRLFSSSIDDSLLTHIRLDASIGRKMLTLEADGTLSYFDVSEGALVWGNQLNSVWTNDAEDKKWTTKSGEQRDFVANDDVIFDNSGINNLTISGAVTAGNMTIEQGDWTFYSNNGSLTIKDGSTLTVKNGTTTIRASVNAPGINLSNNASLNLTGGYTSTGLTAKGAGSVTISGATLASNFSVTTTSGANVTLDNVILQGSIFNLSGQATLSASNGSNFGGTLNLSNNSKLTLGANLNITGFGTNAANGAGMGNNTTIDATTAGIELLLTSNTTTNASDSNPMPHSGIINMTFGKNLTLVKNGTGHYSFGTRNTGFSNATVTVNGDLRIESGKLYATGGLVLNGNVAIHPNAQGVTASNIDNRATLIITKREAGATVQRAINGELSGHGNIQITNDLPLYINGGGKLYGRLDLGWNAKVVLGSNVAFGALYRAFSNGDGSTVSISVADPETDKYTLTLDVSGEISHTAVSGLIVGKGVTLRKENIYRQEINDYVYNNVTYQSRIDGSIHCYSGSSPLSVAGMSNRWMGEDLILERGRFHYGDNAWTVRGDLSVVRENSDYYMIDGSDGKARDCLNFGDLIVEGSLSIREGSGFYLGKTDTYNDSRIPNYTFTSLKNGTHGAIKIDGGSTATLKEGNENATLTKLELLSSVSKFGLESGRLNLTDLTASNGGKLIMGLAGGATLKVGNVNTDTNHKITISVSVDDVYAVDFQPYQLFVEGCWQDEWADLFTAEVWDNLDPEETAITGIVIENGWLRFISSRKDLVWNGRAGDVWSAEESEEDWLTRADSQQSYFANKDSVTFNTDSAVTSTVSIRGTVQPTKMTLASGSWTFEPSEGSAGKLAVLGTMTANSGSSALFTGALELSAQNIHVEENATLTFSNTGAKALGHVTVEEAGRVVITTATGWSSGDAGSTSISGEGTLELRGLNLTVRDTLAGLVSSILPNCTVANSPTLATLELTGGTDMLFTGAVPGVSEYIYSAQHIVVKDGSSIGTDNALMSDTAIGKTVHLEGAGVGGKGALYNGGTALRYVFMNVVLDDNAAIGVATASTPEANRALSLRGGFDAKGNTLTKVGAGDLILGKELTTPESSTGTLKVDAGKLIINVTKNVDTVFAGYDVQLDAGTLQLGGSYTLQRLAGTEKGRVESGTGAAVTLTLSNTDLNQSQNNTYAGSLGEGVVVALAGGYQKFTGEVADGVNFSVNSGATLALGAAIMGSTTVSLSDNAQLDANGVYHGSSSSAVTYRAASGANILIHNLELSNGDVLTFDGAERGTHITLSTSAMLRGGSTLAFEVTEGEDGWQTGGELCSITFGTKVNFDSGKVKIAVDPSRRMDSGEIKTLGLGKYLIIESFTEDDLQHLDKAPQANGYFKYSFEVEEGNLYIVVEESNGVLTWNVAEGGDWRMDNAWSLEGASIVGYQRDGKDSNADCIFTTLVDEETGEDITDAVTVRISGDPVSVGSITVTGNTSYVLDGNITGYDVDGISDEGLTVGTTGAEGKAFTGTLTLTGENTWKGDNILNSGTVIVQNMAALSDVTTSINTSAELRLDVENDPEAEEAAELETELNIRGGAVSTLHDATVQARMMDATLMAAEGATLTVNRLRNSSAGYLRVNDAEKMTGRVELILHSAQESATGLQLNSGELILSAADNMDTAELDVGANIALYNGATLTICSGVTLSGNTQAEDGTILVQDGGALAVSGTGSVIGTLVSEGGSLQGSSLGAGTRVQSLSVLADTTFTGVWDIREIAHEDGLITIAGGTTALNTEDSTELGSVRVQSGGALKGGNAEAENTLSIAELSMGGGDAGAKAAQLAAGSNIATPTLDITRGEIAKGATLTLTGEGSITGSDSAINGLLIVDGGELSVKDAGMAGELTLIHATATLDSDNAAGTATLATADAAIDLAGSAPTTAITLAMAGARLENAEKFAGTAIVDDSAEGAIGEYYLGGLGSEASATLRQLHSDSRVTGIGSSLNLTGASTIYLSNAQLSQENALILLGGSGASGQFTKDAGATLTIDVTAIAPTVVKAGTAGTTYYVFNKGVTGSSWYKENLLFNASLVFYQMDVTCSTIDGSLTFIYTGPLGGTDIYEASKENGENGEMHIDSYEDLDIYAGVVLDQQTTVDLTEVEWDAAEHPDGLVFKNLMSTDEGDLTVTGQGSGRTLITIRNTVKDSEIAQYAEDHHLDIENVFTVNGDVIVSHADMQVKHASNDDTPLTTSRTRMMGRLEMEDGVLSLASGELELAGGADVEDVVFTNGSNGQLIINGYSAAVSNITVENLETVAHAEHVRIENHGELMLKNGSEVGSGVVIGNKDATDTTGSVSVEGMNLIAHDAQLENVSLNLQENSRLTISAHRQIRSVNESQTDEDWNLAGLMGKGALYTQDSKDIDIIAAQEESVFAGSLANYSGKMTVGSASEQDWQVFSGALGSEHWDLTNTNGGQVRLDLMGERGRNRLDMGELTLHKGSRTEILMDLNTLEESQGLSLESIAIGSGAYVGIGQHKGFFYLDGEDGEWQKVVLGTITLANTNDWEKVDWDEVNWYLIRVLNYEAGSVEGGVDDDGNFYIKAKVDNSNKFLPFATNENAVAGAEMIHGVRNANIFGDIMMLQSSLYSLLLEEDGGIKKTPTAGEVAKANRIMAAAAGASTAALGEALGADMERQLRAIRNRTTSLDYDATRKTSVWLNAESNYHKQDADGMMPGFKLNGWGGTVGAHTELVQNVSAGLALTAMYNDVESDGPDRLKGDLDTYYLSAFAQVAQRAWRHTFVATVGTANIDVNRTVVHEAGSYTTKGSTEAFAFGMLYEVGYTLPLKEDYSVCLQPVFNMAWRVSNIDSYTETGTSDAALQVGEQTYSTLTFGLGARVQAAIGSRLWNRSGLLEARALVKADVGDRQGEAETRFASAPDVTGRVRSAERGAIGLELGAGVTIPTGPGSIFADFSAELRADYTNLNAAVGYKLNF